MSKSREAADSRLASARDPIAVTLRFCEDARSTLASGMNSRRLGVSPTAYRERFRSTSDPFHVRLAS